MSESERVPAVTNPLPHDLVRRGIDTSERHLENSCPNRIRSIAYVAAISGNACLNRGDHLPAFLINPTYVSVALVQRPNRAVPNSEKPRLRADRYRLQYFASSGVHGNQDVAVESRDPDYAGSEKRVVGTGRD